MWFDVLSHSEMYAVWPAKLKQSFLKIGVNVMIYRQNNQRAYCVGKKTCKGQGKP